MREAFGYFPRKCKNCGKNFESRYEYAYKRNREYGKGQYYFCSYSCMREYDKNMESEDYKRKFTI